MKMKYKARDYSGGADMPPSIHLDIVEHGGSGGGSASFSEPGREQQQTPGSSASGEPPEKRLTLLALRLAVLEKAASGLGKLGFVWATVVLLGGFASDLKIADFWYVTVILIGEGARVFSRSHELEWQQHVTQTSTAGGALRSSSRFIKHAILDPPPPAPDVPPLSLLPYTGWVFVSRKVGRLLSWLQVVSALACVALSLMRLWEHDFRRGRNLRPALVLFYALALAEASLFLVEKAYWAWEVSVRKLLQQVSAECELGAYGLASVKRFFYDAYSRCISGSVFDGIKMDLVTFAEELILSDFLDEQLIGVRILEQFAKNTGSAGATLRKVGTAPWSMERLVEMLNWKRPDEEEVRRCAAEVVSKLAGKRQNALRVSSIPGAIESVTSLLYTGRTTAGLLPQLPGASAETTTSPPAGAGRDYEYEHLPFNLLGLVILKKLAADHDNCGKMGSARGLLSKIVDFTRAPPAVLRNPHAADSQVRAVKRALQVVKRLVSTAGSTGKALRRGVAENVFAVSNLRDILQHGQRHGGLQKLAADVLTGLAMDEDGKEAIVGTGGVVKLLLSMFLDAHQEQAEYTGEALAMLALESDAGCAAILQLQRQRAGVLGQLMSALQAGDARRLNAARLLRNLCAYSGDRHRERLRAVTEALPTVLDATMVDRDEVLEVSLGLTTQICGFIDGDRFAAELREPRAYVERLASILRCYSYPDISVPRMRRFVVQQVIWLMTNDSGGAAYTELLREVGMEQLLHSTADTTSVLERYHVFSGSVGISKHRESFSAIVDSALELIAGRGGGARAQE
ncbi:unnamed protein product [Urochloa decumbens]|uniref:ARM repeat superfamily protein n=1 Tax=Urochloa decumbens TaxID=240449 RepID=A0ABC9EVQ0_9POAL